MPVNQGAKCVVPSPCKSKRNVDEHGEKAEKNDDSLYRVK